MPLIVCIKLLLRKKVGATVILDDVLWELFLRSRCLTTGDQCAMEPCEGGNCQDEQTAFAFVLSWPLNDSGG